MILKFLALTILLFYTTICHSKESQHLPDFAGIDFVSGATFEFNEYKNKVIYLDFWASWCSPCIESIPFMNKMHLQYSDKEFAIIAINIDRTKKDAETFLKSHPILFKNLYDPFGKIGKRMKVKKMPTSFLIDREGKVLFKHTGFSKTYSDKLIKTIDSILSQ